jgi:hypothetical protein
LRGERDNFSGLAHECNSSASGSDVDREQEIVCHEGGGPELKRKCGQLANPICLRATQGGRSWKEESWSRNRGRKNDLLYLYINKCLIFAF